MASLCSQYICRIGTVHRITDRGDVRVQYSNNIRWTFHPGALTKVQNDQRTLLSFQLQNGFRLDPCLCQVNTFGVGELVQVLDEMETVKRLQAGHGEWTDSMTPVCQIIVQSTKPELENMSACSFSPALVLHAGQIEL